MTVARPGNEEEEELLPGGNITAGVVRVGDTVRRPTSPASPAIHALLRHLEEVGFAGSPRVRGVDDRGREVLTFHPGVTIWPHAIEVLSPDENVARAARLVRELHEASASFSPPHDAQWGPGSADPAGGTLVLHGDLAPWNVVVDGEDWVIIDWDAASPGRVEWELAYVLHTFIPLWHNSDMGTADVVRRLRVFADGYGLEPALLERSLRLVPVRCRKVVSVIRSRARQADPVFVAMERDGHDEHWETAAAHVEARLPELVRALR